MPRHTVRRTLLLILLSLSALGAARAEVRIGVLAPRGELEATTRWAPFATYLTRELGQPVTMVPLNPPKVVPAAQNGEVDFVFSHAAHAVMVQEKLGGAPLATLNSDAGAHFAGAIVAKKGSGITRVEQLRGKHVMSLSEAAAGAYVFQAYYLMQHGLDPHRDLASFKQGKKQDDLVLAVGAGLIDAAFVRSGILEDMSREGKIQVGDFVVVDEKRDAEFALKRTTPLYPEWYVCGLGKTPPELADRLKAALHKLDAGAPAARAAKIKGFIEPLPLDGMKDALRALKLAPYNS